MSRKNHNRKAAGASKRNNSEFLYMLKKPVPAEWTSRHAAAKACGKRGATIGKIASVMHIKRTTATNLVRWMSWNGYLKRSEKRVG